MRLGFKLLAINVAIFFFLQIDLQGQENKYNQNTFESIDQLLPTANAYRTASGAPGQNYYQQKADYQIKASLDESKDVLSGEETITYYNNSPDVLDYLWLQLDQNIRSKNSLSSKIRTGSIKDPLKANRYSSSFGNEFDGGFKIEKLTDQNGSDLPYTINETMMRVDLKQSLKPGQSVKLNIKWWYNINNYQINGGRSGYELFEDGNKLYVIAQWFPRMAVYNDVEGWQTGQFVGAGEFALVFGDYKVELTVPADHILAATGDLLNPNQVLTSEQAKRLKKAENTFDKPVIIVTEQEARESEKGKSSKTKTWKFAASNVRDFAFSSSRKFIWDAMAVQQNTKKVMAMSYYPKEGNPLWEKYSTRVVAHTLRTYSKYTFDYPYPKAISINADDQGMEYPMICWNFGRPEEDGTYPEWIKYGMIGVIIHEVGHNYFPMIVNSDERKYGWMDEGLNSFLEFVAEIEWQADFPVGKGHASKIVPFMAADANNKSTIMTRADYANNYHDNNYQKPATALSILRETVMGRELFDFAFKQYALRWKFKHPTPADFFRTMEDASGMDLGWFWRGWFYSNNYLDLEISDVIEHRVDNQNPVDKKAFEKSQEQKTYITNINNQKNGIVNYVNTDSVALDFYNSYDKYAVSERDKKGYEYMKTQGSDVEKAAMNDNRYFYEITVKNNGQLIMPVLFEFVFEDGSTIDEKIPAEIWRYNHSQFTKVFVFDKKLKKIQLDKYEETSDINTDNNSWPREYKKSRFEVYEDNLRQYSNPMQESRSNN